MVSGLSTRRVMGAMHQRDERATTNAIRVNVIRKKAQRTNGPTKKAARPRKDEPLS